MLKYLLPVLAVIGVGISATLVAQQSRPGVEPTAPPIAAPVSSPFAATVSGSGLVEASSENVSIGTAIAGVVAKVHVQAGDRVPSGAPLFAIDARHLEAELAVRTAMLREAEAALARLEALPRAEDLPPLRAAVAEAEAIVAEREREEARSRSLRMSDALSEDSLEGSIFAAQAARARLDAARAELARAEAGAWESDLAVARANVAAATAAVAAIGVELERTIVRAPIDGVVLSRTVREGQFAAAGPGDLLTLGATERLHVRVDIDENDAWRVRPGAAAVATLRGNPTQSAPLEFVRIEPQVVPKRSLTGFGSERVDTRVLQALYAFDPAAFPAYVGQIVDVRIDASASESSR